MKQLGKYEILGKIGEGGFGVVWKGRDPFLKRLVAIKTCTAEDPDLRKRFLREAEIVGALRHPNVVMVHDFGFQDEVPYLVQELLSGDDLSAVLARGAPLARAERLRILADVARGLGYAHGLGIVHRDVKPGNVRVLEDGSAKVLDFGIAKLAQGATRLTRTGTSVGTVAYMAPEQVEGDSVDHRADIFSFGVLAYELLTGIRPFDAETMSRVFYRILHEEPRPIVEIAPGTPPELERVVRRCLAKDPAARWDSCDEIAAELERLATEAEASAAASTLITPPRAPAAPPTAARTAALDAAAVATGAPPSAPAVPSASARARGRRLGLSGGAAVIVGLALWAAFHYGRASGGPVGAAGGDAGAATGAAAGDSPALLAVPPPESLAGRSAADLVAEAKRLYESERPFEALRRALDARAIDPGGASGAAELAGQIVDGFYQESAAARKAAMSVGAENSLAAAKLFTAADVREDEGISLLAAGKQEEAVIAFDESRRQYLEAAALAGDARRGGAN